MLTQPPFPSRISINRRTICAGEPQYPAHLALLARRLPGVAIFTGIRGPLVFRCGIGSSPWRFSCREIMSCSGLVPCSGTMSWRATGGWAVTSL